MGNDLKIGQTVWLNTHYHGIRKTKILSVGKKYFTIENSRAKFYISTLQEFGGIGCPNTVILSMEAYTLKVEIARKFGDIQRRIQYGLPLPGDQIEAIYSIMFPNKHI